MGVVANDAPDRYAGILMQVPFVDVLVTMCDESIPLVSTEWDEWGNPNERCDYEFMSKYSPIDNCKSQTYPRILLRAGLLDYRVGYWEPAKYAQRLREKALNPRDILFTCEMDEGHTGAMDRYRDMLDISFEFAYVLHCLSHHRSSSGEAGTKRKLED